MASSVWSSVSYALAHISVELIVFLVYLGYIFGNTLQSPAIYRRICRMYYLNEYSCGNLTDTNVELEVQRHNAEWSLYNSVAFLIPSLFADILLGAYGDEFGWKTPIVLGIAGLTIAEFGYLLTLSSSVNLPYWTTLLFGCVSGLSGSLSIIPVACNAYLAEITEDSDILTLRAALFSAFQTMASVLGGFSAAALYNSISVIVAIDIEIFLFLGALVFTIWRIPQRTRTPSIAYTSATVEDVKKESFFTSIKLFFCRIATLLREGLKTYIRRRVGNRRAFLFITLSALVLSYTTSIETSSGGYFAGGVINAYVFRSAGEDSLGWEADDLGYWNAAGYFILAVGTIFGTWLLKRLGFRETTLMLIGIASSGIRVLLIGLASSDVMMYIANVTGVLAGLVQPAGVSFLVQLVAPSEVGKAFSLLGIAGDLSTLITSIAYSILYRFSVKFDAGIVFFFMAGLHVIVFVALLWLHFRSLKEGVGRRRFSSHLATAIARIGSPPPRLEESAVGEEKKKRKRVTISIAEHAESIEHDEQMSHGIWQSEEDLRATRVNRTLY